MQYLHQMDTVHRDWESICTLRVNKGGSYTFYNDVLYTQHASMSERKD